MDDSGGARTLSVLRSFLDDVHEAPPGELPAVVARAAGLTGWGARMYLVDYEQRVLVCAPGGTPPEPPDVLPIEGTVAGRVFQRLEPLSQGDTLWVPLLDGVHRFGVIELLLPEGTDPTDPAVVDRYRLLAHVAGHMIAAKTPYGDALTMLSRRQRRTVASELLWSLLPPLTFGCPGLVVSGILEPCYGVAADAFDYNVVDGVAHLAVFDATGHDLNGTLVAAVTLAAYRNSRREGLGLFETCAAIDEAVGEHWDRQMYVSGVLAQLELATGRLRYVNAGHPAPLLVRRGKVVKQLGGGRRILLGLGDGSGEVAEEWLEPDDWAVLYTDGVTEARDPAGRFYGLERLADQLERSADDARPAPETLRRLMHEVLDHQRGVLQDDATVLVAQWASGRERQFWPHPTEG
ncbi:PP2C family protein-serine/threonine phosphatase [Cellulomonas carbonis]|uniref:Stage II sporulation E family protein n=1 Tax=Cellulomonas carbonis T26 TaxID=947969 RepID=A0A0A0BQV6_9CELL|nr:PP2C family protein-serine/threonine phosphatase [Cellulomonas carbonis]KGM10315.1 stage II sporulation E family protein [Cellulomonas carbonis T26]GGC00243.1 phosphatase [Cellulomonas carbonis]